MYKKLVDSIVSAQNAFLTSLDLLKEPEDSEIPQNKEYIMMRQKLEEIEKFSEGISKGSKIFY